MRVLLAVICLFFARTAPLAARIEGSPFDLAVVLNFKGPHSPASIREMERETGLILKSSGVRLHWGIWGADSPAVSNNLVVMTFTGSCEFNQAPARSEEVGPFAVTRIADGKLLPFAEVDCDRVVRSARGAMSTADSAWADRLVGRAMGRVVAHELVHMLTGSRRHGTEGVAQPALSGEELIGESLRLSMLDIYRVRQELKDPRGSFFTAPGEADVHDSVHQAN